jgi:hypothetical protein
MQISCSCLSGGLESVPLNQIQWYFDSPKKNAGAFATRRGRSAESNTLQGGCPGSEKLALTAVLSFAPSVQKPRD